LGERGGEFHHRDTEDTKLREGRRPDDLSILDQTVIDNARIHGPKQVTDIYLLALAVQHAGRFVTFDGSVPLSAVLQAEKEHLAVICLGEHGGEFHHRDTEDTKLS
jgi:hypothetical protein